MPSLTELLTHDGKIMKMRALGYHQAEIAKIFNVSQSAVSQRIRTIRNRSRVGNNDDVAFWELFMGVGASRLLEKLFDDSLKEGID